MKVTLSDLIGVDWSKIEPNTFWEVTRHYEEPRVEYSDPLEEWVKMLIRESRFNDASATICIHLKENTNWTGQNIPGLSLEFSAGGKEYKRRAAATFEALLALAKDPDVVYIEACIPARLDH